MVSQSQRKPFIALVLALGGFVLQTQLTHYALSVYQRPFFVFYITQSVFTLSLPCHVLLLAISTSASLSSLCKDLKSAIAKQLRATGKGVSLSSDQFPWARFSRIAFTLSIGFSFPTLLWFVGIALTSASDITVIWNANAFFAYLLSVTLLGQEHDRRKFGAVLLATAGLVLVIYGGAVSDEADPLTGYPNRLVGDVLGLIASITYAAFQITYDRYATPLRYRPGDLKHSLERTPSVRSPDIERMVDSADSDSLPFGLESSFWTSVIGLFTMLILWIAFPLLHYFGVEEFSPPTEISAILAILGAAMSAAAFMTGTMMLLASWGAVMTSVSSLLTIVLVFLTDFVLGAAITGWSVFGALAIVVAFGMLSIGIPTTPELIDSPTLEPEESNALL